MHSLAAWMQGSSLGHFMRESGPWTYAIVNLCHIIGIATLFRFWSYRRFVWLAPAAAEVDAVAAIVADSTGAGQAPVEPLISGIPSQPAPPVTRANGHRPGAHRANGNGGRAFGDPAGRPSGSRLRD